MKMGIQNLQDIKVLVDSFYEEIQQDLLIGGVFMVLLRLADSFTENEHLLANGLIGRTYIPRKPISSTC